MYCVGTHTQWRACGSQRSACWSCFSLSTTLFLELQPVGSSCPYHWAILLALRGCFHHTSLQEQMLRSPLGSPSVGAPVHHFPQHYRPIPAQTSCRMKWRLSSHVNWGSLYNLRWVCQFSYHTEHMGCNSQQFQILLPPQGCPRHWLQRPLQMVIYLLDKLSWLIYDLRRY